MVAEIDAARAEPQTEWARQRLRVVRLIAQQELTAAEIMRVADVSRQTRDAQAWIKKRTRQNLARAGCASFALAGRQAEGAAQEPRQIGSGQGRQVQDGAACAADGSGDPAPGQPVRLWVLDEHRYGLLPVIHRVWARRGVRVHAPYATKYQWGYLHEALEVDGAHHTELLFTPAIDRDIHAVFLGQIAASDPQALHVVIQDQAGFHLPSNDPRLPENLRLPPYSPELNPVERCGGLLKARVTNRLYPSLRRLEDHLFAASREWTQPAKVAGLIHHWLADQVNSGAPI